MNTKKNILYFLSCTFLLLSCFDSNDKKAVSDKTGINNQTIALALKPLFKELQFSQPTTMVQAKNLDWYIGEQDGIVYHIKNNTENKSAFLNISNKVKSLGEMGLLGFALDPNFADTGVFYVSYTGNDDYSYISRFHAKQGIADTSSEEVILSIRQPYVNHNGGHLMFGPDGFLYIGFGDGGSAGDPDNNAQNTETLLGSILRIDVNKGSPYSIPETNPLVGKVGKDEIYAYGLRNPWRWSFDKATGDLWLADVGQNAWEEVNIIEKGGNYGWNILEGTHCYANENCNSAEYKSPILEYGHDEGQSITGGFVYRGEKIPALKGLYVYGDFSSGKIWALSYSNNIVNNLLLFDSNKNVSTFAQDQEGELYVVDYVGGIYAIVQE